LTLSLKLTARVRVFTRVMLVFTRRKKNRHVCYYAGTKDRCEQECVGDHCDPKPHSADFASLIGMSTPPPKDCQDGNCAPPPNKNKKACVCTTEEGERYANYINGSYGFWGETGDPQKLVSAQPGDSQYWQTLFKEDESYKNILEHLTVNLGNELYNTSYFVDICYRGPQIDYRGLETAWDMLGKASVTDFGYGAHGGGESYSELSKLKMKAQVICSLQDDSKDYESDLNLDPTKDGPIFSPMKNVDFSAQTPYAVNASSSLVTLLDIKDKKFSKNSCSSAPKFCKIRYTFEETDSSGEHPNMRKWQKHGAQICTFTKIEPTSIERDAEYKP